ncbi:MAG: hypothetical protein ACLR3O_06400 [Streptococcus sp.]
MEIKVHDSKNISKEDLKEAVTKLDASKLPDGEYEFYFSQLMKIVAIITRTRYIHYTFNIQDGKVIQDDDD